jgi:type IV secretory pathway TraG/TraD family ATPase VirD4
MLLKSLDEARSKGEKESFVSIYNEAREQSIAIHSDLTEQTSSFQYLKDLDGDFSIKKWIEKPEGNIFIPNYINEKNTLKPVLSLFIDLLGRHLLTLSRNTDRRIFFFADAFGSLQRISTINNLLALGRHKGASVWLGTQDIGELEKIYGWESRQIIKSCGTRVFFRVPDPANAQYLSDEIGECVRSVPKKSFSMSNPDFWDGVDLSKVERTEPLILPSEIQGLPDLNAFVKFAGHDWVRTKVKYQKFRKKNITFEKNPGYAIQQLKTGDPGVLATKSEAKQTKNTDAVKPDPNSLEPVKADTKPGPPELETASEKQKSDVGIDQAKPEIEKKQAAQEQTSRAVEKGPNLKLSEII